MPIVTPDGRKIVYCSDGPDKMPHIWIMDIDGGNPKQITDGPIEFLPGISPDGKWIVYHTYISGVTSLYKIPIEGGHPVFLLDKLMDTYSPVSPDGKFVACVWLDNHDGKQSWKLAIAPFEGGPVVKGFDIEPSPIRFASLAWASDGKQVMYLAKENGVSNIYQVAIETGKTTKLTNFTSGRIFHFAWSRDGRQLAIARGDVKQDVILISDIKTE
jgi:Tol biopolymer transport system component